MSGFYSYVPGAGDICDAREIANYLIGQKFTPVCHFRLRKADEMHLWKETAQRPGAYGLVRRRLLYRQDCQARMTG